VSKAFTKDEAADEPLVVPPRPPLPAGSTNYVTPRGLDALRAEHRQLDATRARLEGTADADRAHALTILHARVHELDARIASAVVVDPRTQPHDEVRFGARVTVRGEAGPARSYEIVGIDEADAAHGRLAFVAPLARELLGKRVGDVVSHRTPRGEEELEVVAITYDEGAAGARPS
jgi:transcription elongation factor GreB